MGVLAFRGETDAVARLVRRRNKRQDSERRVSSWMMVKQIPSHRRPLPCLPINTTYSQRVELMEENLGTLSLGGDWEDRGSSSSSSGGGGGGKDEGHRPEKAAMVEHRRALP